MRTGAVIVAAKKSARMEQFNQWMKNGEMAMPERVVVNFQRAGVKDIVIVTGYQAETVQKELQHFGVTFLKNEAYETAEMFDSAKIGLSYLKDRCDRILFCPADIPFFSEETVKMMLACDGKLVLPVCKGRQGHPVLIHQSLIPDILKYQGERGLKGALDGLDIRPVWIPVQDEGSVIKPDTEEECRRLTEFHNSRLMRPLVKVRLANQKPFFGPGTVTLLRQIERLGSVREACEKTGISYSKGWKIIQTAEEGLGYQIVERQPGGKNGGTASVTNKGIQLIERFEVYERKVEQAAEEIFQNMFL